MTINGKTSIAPCGHTGETIIGTYVRCLMGCEGNQVMSKRGVPGHVLNCACKPCQIRRVTTHIVLRDKNGKNFMTVPWDGIADNVEAVATAEGDIRGFLFLDAEGKTVTRGNVNVYIAPGKFSLKVSLANLTISAEQDQTYLGYASYRMGALPTNVRVRAAGFATGTPQWAPYPPTVVKGP